MGASVLDVPDERLLIVVRLIRNDNEAVDLVLKVVELLADRRNDARGRAKSTRRRQV